MRINIKNYVFLNCPYCKKKSKAPILNNGLCFCPKCLESIEKFILCKGGGITKKGWSLREILVKIRGYVWRF